MKPRRGLAVMVIVVLVSSATGSAKSRAGRRAGHGAAMGAIWGLVVGGSVESAARHAAAGAAMGAASGAISDSYAKEDARRAAEAQAAEEGRRAEAEQQGLAGQKAVAEAQAAQAAAEEDEVIEAEWIEAIGDDNWNGLAALVDCQHQRAHLLAQAGATVDNEDFKLASLWLEAMIVVDQKKLDQAASYYDRIAARDPDIDTAQQASIEVDRAILEVRDFRRAEGIICVR